MLLYVISLRNRIRIHVRRSEFHFVRANSLWKDSHSGYGTGAMTQLKLPRSKNHKINEHVERHRKGRSRKKQ